MTNSLPININVEAIESRNNITIELPCILKIQLMNKITYYGIKVIWI